MAGYIAKQLVSKPLDAVRSATKESGSRRASEEVDTDALNALEEKRRERFENMEEERENLRQTIRDKYGIKKKADYLTVGNEGHSRSSSPRHSVAGLNTAPRRSFQQDDPSKRYVPVSLKEAANKAVEIPQKIMTEANDKCCTM